MYNGNYVSLAKKLFPSNKYLRISEKPAWTALNTLSKKNLSQLSNDLLKNVDKDKVQKLRKKFISQSFSLSYWKPLCVLLMVGDNIFTITKEKNI